MKKVKAGGWIALSAVLAVGTCSAVGDNAETRRADTPDKPLAWSEIVARPRRETARQRLPGDARIYIGSGVYRNLDGMQNGGFCFTTWIPDAPDPKQQVDLCAAEQVGNTLQFWQSNDQLLELARQAKAKGIHTTCIYSRATNGLARVLTDEQKGNWLGHDFGERYEFSLYQDWANRGVTLSALVDEYMNRVHKHVNDLHAAGWGNVMATSGSFALDYEIAAGTEVPLTEDFPFGDLTLASALSRGLYRQYDLPLWGSHLAHEWYSWIPHRNPCKMKTLETAFYLKYMTGAKLIVNESGNWTLQSSLCEDSPMAALPITCRKLSTRFDAATREKYEKSVLDVARKRYSWIDARSPVATKYRRIISDFYAFCKAHPCPKGQPEATWALAKGNFDIAGSKYIPGGAVCGAYELARKNPNWMHGLPEMSWETVRKAVMPMPPMLAPNKNIHFSASPYGLCDIASFACDNITADFLLKNYKVLMFSGWNTCSPKQYRILCDYVKGGGVLVIGLCHLSTDDARNYTDPTVEKLINKGDLTELSGFKVVGQTSRKYWATGPSTVKNCLGFVARRRFGYMCLPLGKLAFTAPKENFEELAVDDEDAEPFILRCRNGKGQVLFMNWWAYPAAANMDVGCGAETKDVGMVGYLYQYAAKLGRGNVFITGPDFENPDEDCGWILYSYFPDEGKVYLMNLDYERERKCVLQQFGDKDFITLKPAEFRIVDSVKLDPGEKLNAEDPICAHPDSSTWEDVFDKTLSNADMPSGSWKYDAEGWLVPVTGDTILSKKDYGSCIVDCVYTLGPSANSGLFLYDTDHPKHKFEVQILDDDHPMYRDEVAYQQTGSIYGRKPAKFCHSNPPGVENRMTVWCEGKRIRVAVNGMLACEADLDDFRDANVNPDGTSVPPWHKGFPALSKIPTHGRIGLQGIHDSEKAVKFKYLKVQEVCK